ncbi:MAG: energy transducer TonB [Candidatus Kapabacteria bacterium]|nr:energy transducer TonB [Candidatus Kapabacteria bacterium]
MTTTSLRYGAYELKMTIPASTLRGFFGSLTLLVAVFIGYSAVVLANRMTLTKMPTIASTKLMHLPPPVSAQPATPPPPTTLLASGLAARAGTPVPVPDALVSSDEAVFANVDEISRASAEGGNGVEEGTMSLITDSTEVREEEPEMYDIFAVEKEPYIEIRDLQRRVVYPEMAKRAGIQGIVIVRVLVSKDGKPKKYVIERSDSELLNNSASDAVMNSRFTPAIQQNRPVECWVSIPIAYRLR